MGFQADSSTKQETGFQANLDSKQSKQYFARSLNIKILCGRECPVKIGWFYDPKLEIESAWNFRPDRMIQSESI